MYNNLFICFTVHEYLSYFSFKGYYKCGCKHKHIVVFWCIGTHIPFGCMLRVKLLGSSVDLFPFLVYKANLIPQ